LQLVRIILGTLDGQTHEGSLSAENLDKLIAMLERLFHSIQNQNMRKEQVVPAIRRLVGDYTLTAKES
jgi:hypothetical protein